MYKVLLPLLGFDNISKIQYKKDDDYFSTLLLNDIDKLNLKLVSLEYFEDKNIPISFQLENEILKKLKINDINDFTIYFTLVVQDPIENSIVNLSAPILINEAEKIIGQYVVKEEMPLLFTSLKGINL